MAESVNGLYKTERTKIEGPWRSVDALELATLDWVDWYNTARLHSALGYMPPVEYEQAYYRQNNPLEQPLVGQLTL